MKIKELICGVKAVPFLVRTGVWIPHLYQEVETHKGIVIATNNSFRESDSLQHNDNEQVYTDSTIITLKCVYCGKEEREWYNKEPIKI